MNEAEIVGILEKIVEMHRLKEKKIICFEYIKWLKLVLRHGKKCGIKTAIFNNLT